MDMLPRLFLVALGALFLAGAFVAIGNGFTTEGRPRRFDDKDADGEPDESREEKARAKKKFVDT